MRALLILFKITALCIKYSLLMLTRDIQFCLKECKKPGFLQTTQEVALADRFLRRIFSYLQPKNPCLVHCFSLAQAAQDNLKIYFLIQDAKIAPSHAYVKYREQLFSTAKVSRDDANLMIWSKGN